jgi:hypothetical protein
MYACTYIIKNNLIESELVIGESMGIDKNDSIKFNNIQMNCHEFPFLKFD